MRKIWLAATLATCLAIGGAGASQASTDDDRSPGTSRAQIETVQDCDGGVSKRSLIRTQTSPTTIREYPGPGQLTNAARKIVINESQGYQDQVRITFTAEAVLLGATFDTDAPVDALAVEIRFNGVALTNPGDLAFTSGTFGSHATTVCKRVDPGEYWVEVYWQLIDTGVDDDLTGRLDDWALDIQINE